MKIIEQYIQFAIENGLDIPSMIEGWYSIENNTLTITSEGEGNIEFEQNITELIMSKPFIEAIARGLWKNSIGRNEEMFESHMKVETEYIRHKQSDAIYDNNLEEFITNLGIGKQ